MNQQVPLDESTASEQSPRQRGKVAAVVVAVVVVAVAVAASAYAVGASQATTKQVVKTVDVPAASTTTTILNCVPGVAPGSCNTDEAAELAIPDKPLSAATRALLASQLVAARAAANRYPTVADAKRAGMILAGGFGPLVGAHYLSIGSALGGFDPSHPNTYIYDGTSPTSKVIGLMFTGGGLNPPQGFAGPNDHWHRHSNTCVIFKGSGIRVPFPADSSVTKSQCDAVHGMFMRRTTWMVHAWVVPGWESPLGVFSHENPDVLCANGTTKTDAVGRCRGT